MKIYLLDFELSASDIHILQLKFHYVNTHIKILKKNSPVWEVLSWNEFMTEARGFLPDLHTHVSPARRPVHEKVQRNLAHPQI